MNGSSCLVTTATWVCHRPSQLPCPSVQLSSASCNGVHGQGGSTWLSGVTRPLQTYDGTRNVGTVLYGASQPATWIIYPCVQFFFLSFFFSTSQMELGAMLGLMQHTEILRQVKIKSVPSSLCKPCLVTVHGKNRSLRFLSQSLQLGGPSYFPARSFLHDIYNEGL